MKKTVQDTTQLYRGKNKSGLIRTFSEICKNEENLPVPRSVLFCQVGNNSNVMENYTLGAVAMC